MFLFFVLVILLLCLVMIGVVLLQNAKGQGINPSFGSLGGGTQIFGVRRTGDVLERATWILGIGFIVLCLVANLFMPSMQAPGDLIQQGAEQATTPAPAPAPQTPPGSAIPSQEQLQGAKPTGAQNAGAPAPAPASPTTK